jgi:UDP-N-acetylglucosamine:LPS N-acetylglucosamine transferase
VSEATIDPLPPGTAVGAAQPHTVRVLILTTDIGEGHDLPARQLAEGIAEEWPGTQVAIVDGLAAMGRLLNAIVKDQSRLVFNAPRWMFDAEFWLASRFGPTRWLAGTLNYLVGHRGLLRLIRTHAPDVVVSTYPGTTAVLGILRRRRRLSVPAVSAITDLAALRFWAHPGIDVHLLTHEESAEEVRSIAPRSHIRWVRGLTSPGFTEAADPAIAREAFGLPPGAPVAVVSGGGWGVGDLVGAVETALAVPGLHIVVLCGRNDELRERMSARFGSHGRVHVSGFTDKMSPLFAAADVLVHSTAGLTVLEAWIRGCRVISYGWGVAHIRANNEAFARFGIARVAHTRAELARALEQALGEPKVERHETFAALPSAASVVLESVRATREAA